MTNTAAKLHSVTFYISNKKIDFFTEALKLASKKVYGGSGKRTVSKYIRELIYKDLQKHGFLDNDFEPILKTIADLKDG